MVKILGESFAKHVNTYELPVDDNSVWDRVLKDLEIAGMMPPTTDWIHVVELDYGLWENRIIKTNQWEPE